MNHPRPPVGYDFDGVITAGVKPRPGERAVIITGRSFDEAPETNMLLKELGLGHLPIYFSPVAFNDKTAVEHSGAWKATMVKALGVKSFHEDNPKQAAMIRTINPDCRITLYEVAV